MNTPCGCIQCQIDRANALPPDQLFRGITGMDPHFRYACELCGNKRCPHHSDHRNACTGSNEPGQEGSLYQ